METPLVDPERPHVFTDHERELVNKCIDAVEGRSEYLKAKGFTKENFLFGVANSLFVAWTFGALPQHFWIVYLAEVAILFPLRWRNMVKARPKEHFYWLDFCWVANFFGVSIMVILATVDLSYDIHKFLFCIAWGIGNGPLLLATGLLGNALIFHDFDNTASVIIHLLPSLVMYSVGWHQDQVHAAWPHVFARIDFVHLDPFRDIYFAAAIAYTAWWVLYTCWLVTCGMTLPRSGFDTIFHYNMRAAAGKKIYAFRGKAKEHAERAKENDFTRVDAMLYMVMHAVSVYIAILVSLVCFANQWIHVFLCAVMVFSTVNNGASRYTHYMLKSYSQEMRKALKIPFNRKASALV